MTRALPLADLLASQASFEARLALIPDVRVLSAQAENRYRLQQLYKNRAGILYRLFGFEARLVAERTRLAVSIMAMAAAGVLVPLLPIPKWAYLPLIAVAVMVAGIGCMIGLGKAIRYLFADPEWNENYLSMQTFDYMRDHTRHSVPATVRIVAENIHKAMPETVLRVAFIGRDPILRAYEDSSVGCKSVAVKVWDEVDGRAVEVFPPQN